MQFVLFNEHFDVFEVNATAALSLNLFHGLPFFPFELTSNCPTNKLRDTGQVLPILLNRTLTRLVFACQKFVQHTWFGCASRFVFSCMFLFSKVSAHSSPEDL